MVCIQNQLRGDNDPEVAKNTKCALHDCCGWGTGVGGMNLHVACGHAVPQQFWFLRAAPDVICTDAVLDQNLGGCQTRSPHVLVSC